MSSEPRGASAPDLGVLSSTPLAYVAAAAVLVLTVLLAQLTSPLRGAAPVAFDTAATVTYFDRIANGRILETFVPTTPKPLLVFIEGPIWELTHDWRTLTWISVAVFAVGNGLATILGWRLAGAVAGLVTGIALASSSMLTWEALRGLATPWATVGWLVAALAVTARPRRWALAGIALGIAALARVETLAIPAAAGLALVLLTVGPRAVRRPVPRGAWLVLIAFVALPIMLVHDWLLTRNPLYWAQVSGIYSAGIGPSSGRAGVVRALELLVGVFLPYTVVAGLAIVGMVAVARRSALVAFGGVALSIGAIGFILSAGGAGYVLSGRYAAPVVVAMCLGFGVALGLGPGWWPPAYAVHDPGARTGLDPRQVRQSPPAARSPSPSRSSSRQGRLLRWIAAC